MSEDTKTAFVMAGGGSLGAIQVGMLRALAAHRVVPDLLVGASVGAINSAYFGWSPDAEGVAGLEKIWRGITRGTIFPFSPVRSVLGIVSVGDSLVKPDGLRRMLRRNLPYERLEETKVPVYAVATDILSGTEVVISQGNAIDALVASAAIPGMFPPAKVGEREVVDGGVASNTPISVAAALGATRVVVLPAGYACALGKRPRGPLGVVLNSLNHIMCRQLVVDVERFQRDIEVRVVPPLCPLQVSSSDFSRTEELMDSGQSTTEDWIAAGGLEGRAGDPFPMQLMPHIH